MNTETNSLPQGYSDKYFNGMDYGLFVPPNYNSANKYPLVIHLHGSTDTKSWNLIWYNEPIITSDPCIVLTPKSYVKHFGWGSSYDDEHSPDMQKTLELIQKIINDFSIDESRLYVDGASMGGYGVFSLLAKEPEMFAAAVAICGGGDPSLAKNYMKTPLWMFHGSEDPIISVEQSRNIFNEIIMNGGKIVRYTEYEGVEHDSWLNAWKEEKLIPWILAQRKGDTFSEPKPVENLTYKIVNDETIDLSWNEPADFYKIWYYKISQNGKVITESESSLIPIKIYETNEEIIISVSAVDFHFQESEKRFIKITIIPFLNV